MAYHLSGRTTELCSCNTPCPCAFGQEPTGGTCAGIFCFDIQQGECDGVDLSGTKAVLAGMFSGVWTSGNFTAAMILDEHSSTEQRDALTRILSGQEGGDAAGLAGLIGDMKGVFVAPIDYKEADGHITVLAGDIAEGAGEVLRGLDGISEIQIQNAHYPIPNVTAGRATRSRVRVPGLEFDSDGSGMWTGPFEMRG
jgi:hypothetical protein